MSRSNDRRWEPEPRIGRIQTGGDGSRWRKARILGDEGWGRALCHAHSAIRVGLSPSREDIEAMGYDLLPESGQKHVAKG
jgi:hypothetical protein